MWLTAEKRFLWHVCLRNPFPPNCRYSFKQIHSTHEEIRESVRVDYWVGSHNSTRTPGSIFELWISDGFEWFFVVNFLYPKFAVLARSKQLILMPVTVKFRLDLFGLWSPRPFVVASWQLAKVGPPFPFNKGHEAMTNCRDSLPKSLRSLRAAARSTGSEECLHHACKR